MAILIDANVLYAYTNAKDAHYKESIDLMKKIIGGLYGIPIITDYLFDEIVSVVSRKNTRGKAKILGEYLLTSQFRFVRINTELFKQSWNIFTTHERFSFTDCTNIAVLQTFKIEYIATFDKEFKTVKGIRVINQ
ncbi:type II toxin-antitoxin system VapC family toxin [Candidatus Woesearchaeota archaeon]|nr:type II toxin-antitoxin system VapC family toxin [Candidatus Woesearchaeota archaeon]